MNPGASTLRSPTVTVFESPLLVAQETVRRLVATASAASQEGRTVSWMLAGGTTPKLAYQLLREAPIDWSNVHLYFGDERAVAPDHADSNLRMAREALTDHVPLPASHLHPMPGDDPDRDAAAARYAASLPERIDVLLLGMGQDGHTASLFPGAKALSERERLVRPVIGPKPPPQRLTITPPVFARATEIWVLVTGADKAEALAQALAPLEGDERLPSCAQLQSEVFAGSRPPVGLLFERTFLIDRAASARLPAALLTHAPETRE